MKKKAMRTIFLLGAFVSAGVANGQEDLIDLYMQPDTQGPKVDSVSLEDPRLGQPAPVMDEAMVALGWHFAEFEDVVEGYTPDGKIGKDLLPVNGAIIYSGPSSDSPVLGTYRDGSFIEIKDTGAWWKFDTRMRFPVYFLLDYPPPLPPVTGAAEEPLMAPEPVMVEAAPVATPAPMIEETPIVDAAATPASVPQAGRQPDTVTPPDVIGQVYHGTFKRSKRTLGLFKPHAPFYLESPEGNRIAWIDTDKIVIPGSLKTFLDKEVIIHGERDFLESTKGWIIRARNMRLK